MFEIFITSTLEIRSRLFFEVEKNSFIYFVRQRGARQAKALKILPHFLENRKWSCSCRVENRLSIRIGTDVVLHSSFLLETLRSLGLVAGGSRTGSGGPWGHHSMTFLLAWRILTKKRSVRECCLQEVNIGYIVQLWLGSNHFQSTIKQERGKQNICRTLYGQKE